MSGNGIRCFAQAVAARRGDLAPQRILTDAGHDVVETNPPEVETTLAPAFTPALFATLEDRALAGNLAGLMFEIIAWTGMACAPVLLIINPLEVPQSSSLMITS